MSKTVLLWSSKDGDVPLNAALLASISAALVSTPITTAGDGVLTAAAIVGGQIGRTGPVAAFTDTTATAAAIVTALGGFTLGQSFEVRIKNATAFPQALAAGTGVTLPGAAIIPPASIGGYFGTVGGTAASPTVVFTHISTTAIYSSPSVVDPQAAALVTVGAGVITAAGIAGGLTKRGGSQSAAFTDTTDTAAAIIAAVPGFVIVGAAFLYTYINNTIWPATLAGGVGVTLSGDIAIPPNGWGQYLVTITAAGAVSMLATAQGVFPKAGTVDANGATPVAVVDANVTASSQIGLTLKTVGGTPHGAFVSAITPGTGFSINSLAGDTSTYNYEIRG